MKNISIIMARGIEGCGVTKYTVEQVKWLKNHGYNTKVHAAKDKSYSRKYAHNLGEVNHFKFANSDLMDSMIESCNNSDLIVINSLPSKDTGRGAGSGSDAVRNWIRALASFNKPVVLIQHDHTIYSIKRNAALDEAVNAADIVFAHARTNDFSNYVRQMANGEGTLSSFFGEVESKQIFNFQPGIDFESNRKVYWKDIEEQDPKHHKWIGRCTSWKGYKQMFEWHNNYLKPAGYLTTFEGIEKSPAFLGFKELSDFENCIDKKPEEVEFKYGNDAYVFGPYVNDELLHRMSRVGFGYQLSILDQKYIEKSIEYTHCELATAGVVPVFRKEYGERCIHRVTGDPLIHSKGNNTVWLNSENMPEQIELIHKLTNDNVMRNEWREGAYEFYKQHQDSEYVFDDMMKTIKDHL